MNLTLKDKKFKLSQIADLLEADLELNGCSDAVITGVDPIEDAKAESISFVNNPKYLKWIEKTEASAVIVNKKDALQIENCKKPLIISKDAYHDFQKMLHVFYQPRDYDFSTRAKFVSKSETAIIGENNQIADFVYFGKDVIVGNDNIIYPFVFIGDNVRIGKNCIIYPNVSIMEDSVIGDNVIIQPGAVVGSDGFGFVPTDQGYYKIPQVGSVVVGDNVEIGACSSIDRAALKATEIADGVKIDNLCQIAHNVKIGSHTAIAAQAGISGSTTIGSKCIIAGQAGLVGHIKIGNSVTIGAQAGVSKDVEDNMILTGTPARPLMQTRKNDAYISKLAEMNKKVKHLEKKLLEIEEKIRN